MAESSPSIIVIGAGFAGLCLGMRLKKAGIESFTILEKADGLGGTWRDNTYPGAACDVPSFAYCFSFEQKTDWSRKWAPQREILDYMRHCAEKYGLLAHMRFETEVLSARFDASASEWRVQTSSGDELRARYLVSAVGQLSRPHVPPLPGLRLFGGTAFHSARWNHDCDLTGKRVAVVGSAASAVQIVPELAKTAATLHVLQRSPNWILPKNDREYSPREKALFGRFRFLALLYRWLIWFLFEIRFALFLEKAFAVRIATRIATKHLEAQVEDAALRRTLTPDYPVGAKRILTSDEYYPALQRSNVRLVTAPIREVTTGAVRLEDGESVPVDAIVLATGFETTEFLVPMTIEGEGGARLHETWRTGAAAYLGMAVPGFPNFFMMYGPNTNLGHNSILFMLECQSRYIAGCIQAAERRGFRVIDLEPEVFASYDRALQDELSRTAWARVDRSWYKDAHGRITNNWSGTTTRYFFRTRRADLGVYRCRS